MEYNKANNIIPQSIQKDVRDIIEITKVAEDSEKYSGKDKVHDKYGMFTKLPEGVKHFAKYSIDNILDSDDKDLRMKEKLSENGIDRSDIEKIIEVLEKEMKSAAKNLDFERAAQLRDKIMELRRMTGDGRLRLNGQKYH